MWLYNFWLVSIIFFFSLIFMWFYRKGVFFLVVSGELFVCLWWMVFFLGLMGDLMRLSFFSRLLVWMNVSIVFTEFRVLYMFLLIFFGVSMMFFEMRCEYYFSKIWIML